MLGMNVGPTSDGNATFTGKGRYFAPFAEHYGFQSEGEYFYSKGQREGQFDFGLVDRVGNFQAGLFSSFKHVNLPATVTGVPFQDFPHGQIGHAPNYVEIHPVLKIE